MTKNTLTVKQKEVDSDLNIIAILTILSFIGYILFQKQILDFSHQTEFPVWIRLHFLATLQFCVAGFGDEHGNDSKKRKLETIWFAS